MARRITDYSWPSEAAMVADFMGWARHCGWTPYGETAGWDVLLVRDADGFQIGVEAKPVLNATVVCQVLERDHLRYWGEGPDCRAVLVPRPKVVSGLQTIARRLGIVVISGSAPDSWAVWKGPRFEPRFPEVGQRYVNTDDEMSRWASTWPELCPDERCKLPEYVPDVTGGHSAPIALTPWKIQAIKAAIIIETVGYITRADFRALKIDPTRWTQFWLTSIGDKRWAASVRLPNFKVQHPLNYEQIRSDLAKWGPAVPSLQPLLGSSGESPP